MRSFRLRSNLQRVVLNGFALPLGIESGDFEPPQQGYTIAYTAGEEDEPDTYAFHVVVSHERLRALLHRAFELLPDEVCGIVEIGSRDAYRSVDVFLGDPGQPLPVEHFLRTWNAFEPVLLEDASIGAGANCEEPFVEVFLDQWKGLNIHVPLHLRDEVEAVLQSLGLEEVPETWPLPSGDDQSQPGLAVRPVLEILDEYSPDMDELLLQLREAWRLELNVDPDENVDEGGRELGLTLWHAVTLVEDANGDRDKGAYASIWATAGSLTEMERLIEAALVEFPEWRFAEIYTIDRVAFDERPEELAELRPRRDASEVHLVQIDSWEAPPPERTAHDRPA